ncbi:hypothetical protein OMAG_001216, partial [Candidatus Omnitrophus magneticus]
LYKEKVPATGVRQKFELNSVSYLIEYSEDGLLSISNSSLTEECVRDSAGVYTISVVKNSAMINEIGKISGQ